MYTCHRSEKIYRDQDIMFLLIVIGFLPFSMGIAPTTLRQVHLIFRHGDRSPTGTFPTDPHKEDTWPQGFGQLSKLGIQQEYELGRLLRNLYGGFLNKTYIRDEFYIRSTDKDRTLMSAYAVLSGLYPPEDFQVWNKNIKWQPIPVHTVSDEKDNLLSLTNSKCDKLAPMVAAAYQSEEEKQDKLLTESASACKKYHMILMELFQSEPVLMFEKSNQEFLDMVRNETGLFNASLYDIMEKVPNPLFCEKTNNISLPEWVTDDVYTRLQDLKTYQSKLWFFTPEMQRLRAGVFLSELVNDTEAFIAGNTERKMHLYSAHDTTLTGILIALKVWDELLPPYSSFLVFELHQNADGKFFMRLNYKNDTNLSPESGPMNLIISGCSEDCEWSRFHNSIDSVVYKGDWFKECSVETTTLATTTNLGIVIAVLVIMIVLIVVIGAIYIVKHRRTLAGSSSYTNF